jgi:hypothetical protein
MYGSDGSGGKYSRDKRLRSCGSGGATLKVIQGVWRVVGGFASGVTGAQTVPRSELTAVSIILENATASWIHIVVDASYIFKGIARGPKKVELGSHIDLWDRFWELIARRGGPQTVQFTKVASHCTQEEILCGVEPLPFVLHNEAADYFASLGAKYAEASEDDVLRIKNIDQRS